MSCSGCRVLRKGCSDSCILRSSLQWIESAEAQGHATVFVAKFFGRAGMLSFINAVAESQRPALFQSLLYEACGRTVNPVFGAVGLLWSGNWGICQSAVETVLKGGSLKPTACPPCTETVHENEGNPPLKRLLSSTEPSMNPNAQVKRVKSLNTQRELPELAGDAQVGNTNTDESFCVVKPDTDTLKKSDFSRSLETPKQAQRPATCAELVVPVARRAKPPVGFEFASKFVARDHQWGPSFQEHDWNGNKAIELDLSLNSLAFENANSRSLERRAGGNERVSALNDEESRGDHITLESSMCHEEEHASCIEVARSSSPCSFSINSDGSVASVDTTEVSVSGVQSFIGDRLRQENYHLLHLL